MITFFKIGYFVHPAFPYARIQKEQATKLIISHFRKITIHSFMTPLEKKTQLVCLYFVYKHKKNASRTDIMDDDQKSYAFARTYGDVSTTFQRHIISVVLFSSSNKLQNMFVDYAVT